MRKKQKVDIEVNFVTTEELNVSVPINPKDRAINHFQPGKRIFVFNDYYAAWFLQIIWGIEGENIAYKNSTKSYDCNYFSITSPLVLLEEEMYYFRDPNNVNLLKAYQNVVIAANPENNTVGLAMSTIEEPEYYSKLWGEYVLRRLKAELADMREHLDPETIGYVLRQLFLYEAPLPLSITGYYEQRMPHISPEDWINKTRKDLKEFTMLAERISFKRFLEIMEIKGEEFQKYIILKESGKECRKEIERKGNRKGETVEGSIALQLGINGNTKKTASTITELAKTELESTDRRDLYCMWLFLQGYITERGQIL